MGYFDVLASSLRSKIGAPIKFKINQLPYVRELTSATHFADSILGASTTPNPGTGQIPSDFPIDAFRNNLSSHGEVAKSDKFDVTIIIPTLLQGQTTSRELALQCEASELPGRDINMIEFRHYGFTKRIPHMNQYGQITLTFYCAGDMHEKKLFDRWLDIMIPTNSGLVSYPIDEEGNSQYESDVYINQYNPSGELIYQVKLFEALPVAVSPLTQNWSDDSVHRLVVTFAYKKWVSGSTVADIPAIDFSGVSNKLDPNSVQTQYSADGTNNYTNENNTIMADQRVSSVTSVADNFGIDFPNVNV